MIPFISYYYYFRLWNFRIVYIIKKMLYCNDKTIQDAGYYYNLQNWIWYKIMSSLEDPSG